MSEPALHDDAPEVIVRVMATHNRCIDDFLADCRARGWSEPPSSVSSRPEQASTQHLADALHDEAQAKADLGRSEAVPGA